MICQNIRFVMPYWTPYKKMECYTIEKIFHKNESESKELFTKLLFEESGQLALKSLCFYKFEHLKLRRV